MRGILKILVGVILPLQVHAWGLLQTVSNEWYKALLTTKVLRNGELSYCVRLSPDALFLNEKNMATEVHGAITLWLRGAGIGNQVKVTWKTCPAWPKGVPGTDLVVLFAKRARGEPITEAYADVDWNEASNSYWSVVKIITDYTFKERGNLYTVMGFSNFTLPGETLVNLIQGISFNRRLSTDEFAKERNVDPSAVWMATYPTFLHEFGHAFGLCDMYNVKLNCDRQYMSHGTQPPSVMKDSDYFYLTADDLTGLKTVYQHLRQVLATDLYSTRPPGPKPRPIIR